MQHGNWSSANTVIVKAGYFEVLLFRVGSARLFHKDGGACGG